MANLDFYGMFDYSTGDSDIYKYSSAEFSKLIQSMTDNGVTNSTNSFATTKNGTTLTVAAGTCYIQGRYGYNDSAKTMTVEAEAASLQRIDRLVLELNVSTRIIELKIVKGTAAATAAVPALTQNSVIYQIPLYRIKITNGSTLTLTDERRKVYSPTEAVEKLNRILNGTDKVYAVYA